MNEAVIDPSVIKAFLADGSPEEVHDFVSELLSNISDSTLSSALFCRYLCMTVRIAAHEYAESAGLDTKDFLKSELDMISDVDAPDNARKFVRLALRRVISMRQQSMSCRYRDLVARAVEYIDAHFADNDISLNSVAQAVNLSPNYFSALFSQETGGTFIEYLTSKRIEQACRLLRESNMRSSDIAASVGYNDPHYFSFLFKKTQGCTPRDYRQANQQQ